MCPCSVLWTRLRFREVESRTQGHTASKLGGLDCGAVLTVLFTGGWMVPRGPSLRPSDSGFHFLAPAAGTGPSFRVCLWCPLLSEEYQSSSRRRSSVFISLCSTQRRGCRVGGCLWALRGVLALHGVAAFILRPFCILLHLLGTEKGRGELTCVSTQGVRGSVLN